MGPVFSSFFLIESVQQTKIFFSADSFLPFGVVGKHAHHWLRKAWNFIFTKFVFFMDWRNFPDFPDFPDFPRSTHLHIYIYASSSSSLQRRQKKQREQRARENSTKHTGKRVHPLLGRTSFSAVRGQRSVNEALICGQTQPESNCCITSLRLLPIRPAPPRPPSLTNAPLLASLL